MEAMSVVTFVSLAFGCVGLGFTVGSFTRAGYGVITTMAALLVLAPLWQIAAYVEQIAKATP